MRHSAATFIVFCTTSLIVPTFCLSVPTESRIAYFSDQESDLFDVNRPAWIQHARSSQNYDTRFAYQGDVRFRCIKLAVEGSTYNEAELCPPTARFRVCKDDICEKLHVDVDFTTTDYERRVYTKSQTIVRFTPASGCSGPTRNPLNLDACEPTALTKAWVALVRSHLKKHGLTLALRSPDELLVKFMIGLENQ